MSEKTLWAYIENKLPLPPKPVPKPASLPVVKYCTQCETYFLWKEGSFGWCNCNICFGCGSRNARDCTCEEDNIDHSSYRVQRNKRFFQVNYWRSIPLALLWEESYYRQIQQKAIVQQLEQMQSEQKTYLSLLPNDVFEQVKKKVKAK